MKENVAFIYFIEAGPFVKIGVSRNPERRFQQLQNGCPFKFSDTRVFKMSTGKAWVTEQRIHNVMNRFSTHGEWYRCSMRIALAMASCALCIRKEAAA